MDEQSTNGIIKYCLAVLLLVSNSSMVFAQEAQNDPFEPVNRVVHRANEKLDQFILRPVAQTYSAVTPNFLERGVQNFFSNLSEVRNVAHNTLQGKPSGALSSAGRFLINSTVGIGGLFDVAQYLGIEEKPEDLGQTLGVWGVGAGPYLVLPLLGPSSVRDSAGFVVDPFLNPVGYSELEGHEQLGLFIADGIQTRASLLSADGLFAGDTYAIYKSAYLSSREYAVNDGKIVSDDFLDDDLNVIENDSDDFFLDESF